jgi:diguanylate cyclase (GGDEF)-like protein/PAS domain S-box-containing protein
VTGPQSQQAAPPIAEVSKAWWQRLHAWLMPNYNRRAATFWWLMVVSGAVVLAFCLFWLVQQPWQTALQIAIGLALAVGSGLFPVRIPGTKESFAAGEVFIFLVLLLLGPQAAAIVAAGETGLGAFRTSKRWTSRLVSPAISALAIWGVGTVLTLALEQLAARGYTGAAAIAGATMLFAALYFVVNAVLLTGIYRLNRGEPFLRIVEPVTTLRWVGMAYAGSAALATLLYVVFREQGSGVLWVMVPLLAMLLVTLHFYFRQQEAHEALRLASAGQAEREAAALAREKESAERHLRELQASERRFHSAFTHASIGMALLDLDGAVLQVNRAMTQLLGLEETELLAQGFYDFLHAEDRTALDTQMAGARKRSFEGFEGFALELRGRHRDNSTVWMALNCSFFTEPGADAPLLILQAQDISGRRRAEAGLQHMAFHDSLTGLPNRRRFLECLAGAVARYQANPARPWAVMFIDFDRFKLVNDSLGHTAGDELLVQMARRVQERLRPSDVVARLGGDEFAILADHIDDERHALVLAERLMDALRRPFLIGDVELIASASIGITFSAIGYDSAEDALRDADTAMYKAKGAGKARYAVFDASLHTAVADRLRLEGELRRAIDRGELTVEYQPVFDLVEAAGGAPGAANGTSNPQPWGRLTSFEALVRWQHPSDGRLLPGSFLHVAEESGLMLSLSDFVMHSACHQLRQWQLMSPENEKLTISINLSAHDLASPALVARVSRAIVESGLRAQDLTLELTENILMSHIEGALGALTALRKLGVKLAVDDFGTGYSSLSHLSRLPIDSLKIDRSFVSQLRQGGPDAAVVSAIVQLGSALRKAVVAEGIESAAQLDHLRELGCNFGQGFHMGTPLTAQMAGEWLRRPPAPLH